MKKIVVKSISRERSKVVKCAACGAVITDWNEALTVEVPHQKNGRSVHLACVRPRKLNTFTPAWYEGCNERKATLVGKVAIATVYKCKPHDSELFPAWLYAAQGILTTPTTRDGYVMTHPRLTLSRHGEVDVVETLASKADIIRYSVEGACYNDDGTVYRPELTIAVYNALHDVPHVVNVEYRDNSLRVYADFTDVKNAVWLEFLVQDILQCARDNVPESTIVRHIKKHIEGRATWQRHERNK